MKFTHILLPAVVAAGALLGFACGGGGDRVPDDRVLHLRNSVLSAADYRTFIRSQLGNPGAADLCAKVRGLSPAEAYDATAPTGDQSGKPSIPSSTPVPSQTPARDDAIAAMQIFQEECAAAPSVSPATPVIVVSTPTPAPTP